MDCCIGLVIKSFNYIITLSGCKYRKNFKDTIKFVKERKANRKITTIGSSNDSKKIDPFNFPIFIVLVLLIYSLYLLFQQDELLANEIAKYAYYFLIVGVIVKGIKYLTKTLIRQEGSLNA